MAGGLCTSGQDILALSVFTHSVSVECTYNIVFLFCPVGVDDTTVLGKLC